MFSTAMMRGLCFLHSSAMEVGEDAFPCNENLFILLRSGLQWHSEGAVDLRLLDDSF